jgi:hypothetical protein
VRYRHGGRRLNFFHRETRADVKEFQFLYQLLIHAIVFGNARYHNAQHIVRIAAKPMCLDDFRHPLHSGHETAEPVARMPAGAHRDEHCDPNVHLLPVEQRDAGFYIALLWSNPPLRPVQPPSARHFAATTPKFFYLSYPCNYFAYFICQQQIYTQLAYKRGIRCIFTLV